MLQINGMPNHIHFLIGLKPNCKLSDLIRDIKSNSTKWINEKTFNTGKFEWQKGFGAFTVSHSQLNKVINYIINQKEHHKKSTFNEEYIAFLKGYNIVYDEKYLFS